MTIIIDSDDYAASGIETLFFPGGEPHAKAPLLKNEDVLLYLKLRTWNDVGLAMCVMDALLRQPEVSVDSFIPYFPGARQDRTDGTAPLTDGLMSLILTRNVMTPYVFDVHNPNRCGLGSNNFMPKDLPLPQRPDVDFVIAPDKGAVERAEQFRETFCPNAELMLATKRRDPHTGHLSHYTVEKLPRFGKCLVVDDICDGGGTFILLAQAIEEQFENSCKPPLELFVSHGIFSKGLDTLCQYYTHIYTTDSFHKHEDGDKLVTTYSLAPLLEKIQNA